MRNYTRIILAAGVVLTIAGCGGEEELKPEDTFLGTQVEAINTAEEVEQLLLDTSRTRADDSDD